MCFVFAFIVVHFFDFRGGRMASYSSSAMYSDLMRSDTDLVDIRSIGSKVEDAESAFHVLEAFFFIGTIWVFGKVFGMIHGKLIGEIIAGFLLGPQGYSVLAKHFSFLIVIASFKHCP